MFSRARNKTTGFTLIELLIVIGIIVILSVVVVLTLNPAQLLAQSRDSRRVSDLSTLQSALSLYLADVSSPSLGSSTQRCYAHGSSSMLSATTCSGRFAAGTNTTSSVLTPTGSGWIPVDLTQISAGAPVSNLPTDPVNNATYYMAYSAVQSALTFEMNADMESTKYNSGSGNLEATDGGSSSTLYEVGTDSGLDI